MEEDDRQRNEREGMDMGSLGEGFGRLSSVEGSSQGLMCYSSIERTREIEFGSLIDEFVERKLIEL